MSPSGALFSHTADPEDPEVSPDNEYHLRTQLRDAQPRQYCFHQCKWLWPASPCVCVYAGSLISCSCIACAALFQVWRPPTRGPDSTLKRQGEEKLPTWARRDSNGGKNTAVTLAMGVILCSQQHLYALADVTIICKGTAGHLLPFTGA